MSWRLAYALEDLRAEVLERWPGTTVWTIGDQDHASRASDHNPNQEDVVCAVDVLGREKAHTIWHHLLDRRDHRTKYMIFDRQIVSSTRSPWQVRRYGGRNPHSDHIHVSVGRGPDGRSTGPYDERGPWGLTQDPDEEGWIMATEEDWERLERVVRGVVAEDAPEIARSAVERALNIWPGTSGLVLREGEQGTTVAGDVVWVSASTDAEIEVWWTDRDRKNEAGRETVGVAGAFPLEPPSKKATLLHVDVESGGPVTLQTFYRAHE